MFRLFLLSVTLFIIVFTGCRAQPEGFAQIDVLSMNPPEHQLWDSLLKTHVQEDGMVNYRGFITDSVKFNKYLYDLSSTSVEDDWSEEEKMAFWINAYNAFTIKLIIDNYPLESIKDIKKGIPFVNSVWDIKFISIGGEEYDLNNIEHSILRKDFSDARIHAAINCASISCPPLLAEAYFPDRLNDQLDKAMKQFVNDPERNKINAEKAELSKIFDWFGGDFKKDAGSVIEFINRYSEIKLGEGAEIMYLDYNWSLNEAKP